MSAGGNELCCDVCPPASSSGADNRDRFEEILHGNSRRWGVSSSGLFWRPSRRLVCGCRGQSARGDRGSPADSAGRTRKRANPIGPRFLFLGAPETPSVRRSPPPVHRCSIASGPVPYLISHASPRFPSLPFNKNSVSPHLKNPTAPSFPCSPPLILPPSEPSSRPLFPSLQPSRHVDRLIRSLY